MEHLKVPDTQPWVEESPTSEGHARLRAKVGGMHCSLCTGIVESALRKWPGVHRASVGLRDGQALIEYDRGRTAPEQLLNVVRDLGFSIGDARAARKSTEDTSALVSEGRKLLGLFALSAVTVPLMLLEMWNQLGGWVGGVLGALAVVTFLLAPQLVAMTVESRHRGLLSQAPVVRASVFGGLVGGVIGLVFRPEHYPTGGFFAVTVLVVAYYSFSRWLALLVRTHSSHSVEKRWSCSPTPSGWCAMARRGRCRSRP